MTALLTIEFEDDTGAVRKLTREEVLIYVSVVAGAGNETTGRLIGWLGKVLGEHPDERRDINENRELIPNVIDEMLRFEPTGPAPRPLCGAGPRISRDESARGQRHAAAGRLGEP